MKSLIVSLAAGLAVLASSRDASAFGRGHGGGGHAAAHPAAHAAAHPAAHPAARAEPHAAPHPEAHAAAHAEAHPEVRAEAHHAAHPEVHAEAHHAAPPAAHAEAHTSAIAHSGGHGAAGGAFGGVHGLNPTHSFDADRAERETHVGGFPHDLGAAAIDRGGVGAPGGDFEHGAFRGGAAIGGGRSEGGRLEGGGLGGGRLGGGRLGGGFVGTGTRYIGAGRLGDLANTIRGNDYPYFTRGWFGSHGGAWFPGLWYGNYGPWDYPQWDGFAPFLGITTAPIPYDFGTTCVISDGQVYLNGQAIGTLADFIAQATALANASRAVAIPQNDQWQPLGVFGLVRGNETVAERIFQLAVDKNGIIRGNYYDALMDNTQPVFGQVDPKTQLAVWTVGDRKDIVYEAGIDNLLQNESTCLVHYGSGRTVEMVLVRLPAPPGAQQQAPGANQPPPSPVPNPNPAGLPPPQPPSH